MWSLGSRLRFEQSGAIENPPVGVVGVMDDGVLQAARDEISFSGVSPGGVRHRVTPLDGPPRILDVFYPIRDEYR